MKRPKAFAVGKIRVRIHSGPNTDGRWRWRADRPSGDGDRRISVWSGWGTRDEVEAAVLQVAANSDPLSPSDVETVFDLLDVWLAAELKRPDITASTRGSRAVVAKRLARSDLRHIAVARVTRATLEHYRDTALRAGAAIATVRLDLVTLRTAWRWGHDLGLLTERDLPVVRLPRPAPVYSRRTPTQDEGRQVITWLRDHAPAWAFRTAYLAWATGARKAEVVHISWSALRLPGDGSTGAVDLLGKTGARTVPLHPDVVAEVQSWPVDGAGPIANPARSHRHVREWLHAACEALAIQPFSPHGLRRSAVDVLYRRVGSPEVAAAMLGHSAGTALRHYRQVTQDEVARAVLSTGLGATLEEGDNVIDLSKNLSKSRRPTG